MVGSWGLSGILDGVPRSVPGTGRHPSCADRRVSSQSPAIRERRCCRHAPCVGTLQISLGGADRDHGLPCRTGAHPCWILAGDCRTPGPFLRNLGVGRLFRLPVLPSLPDSPPPPTIPPLPH